MNPLFGDVITVYNRMQRGRAPVWKRTVISGVQVKQRVKSDFTDAGKSIYKTETSITIPYGADSGGAAYEPPERFDGAGWTLNPADGQDVIVLGVCEREIDEDYSIDALIKEHKAVTVRAATDNTNRPRLKTWKAVCE